MEATLTAFEYVWRLISTKQTAANAGLARTFEALGEKEQAIQICVALVSRIGDNNECGLLLETWQGDGGA